MDLAVRRRNRMSEENFHEELINRVISGFIKEQTAEVSGRNQEDRSFVYLEKETLNRVLRYLLLKSPSKTLEQKSESSDPDWLVQLEQMRLDNQKDFEEFINVLKEMK